MKCIHRVDHNFHIDDKVIKVSTSKIAIKYLTCASYENSNLFIYIVKTWFDIVGN